MTPPSVQTARIPTSESLWARYTIRETILFSSQRYVMDIQDELHARSSGPAADPRVRAFADRALEEIRTETWGSATTSSLLSDKEAFCEYMYRLNESVLLGLSNPPSATPNFSFDQKTSEEGRETSEDQILGVTNTASKPKSNNSWCCCAQESVSPARTRSLMISNKCRSEHSDERDESEASAAVSRGRPSLPPDEDKTTIRFNLDHAGAHFPGTLLSNVPARGWAGGAKVVGDCGRSAEDAGNESLLSRNPRGQSLLEELRRWRLQALERIEGTERRHRQPPKASSCLQPRELPPAMSHSKSSALPSSPTSTRMEPETQKDGCLPTAAIPGESLPPPPIQPITEGLSRSGRGLGLLEAARAITAGHTSSVEKYCDGSHMVEMISSRCARVPKESLSTAEAAAVSTSRPKGRITREMSCHAGERGGGGRLQQVSKDGEGGGDEGQGCVEVSLDLSNCNQEKLECLLERGRARGGGIEG